jgi:hypothetical protein
MSYLTDLSFAPFINQNTLFHLVNTGDTSQNPAGSSYKGTIQGILDLVNPISITGGTYDPITGVVSLCNTSGICFDISGFTTGYTDIKVTGYTYDNNNTFTISETDGTTHSATINQMSGLTINGDLTVTGNTNLSSTTASTLNISTTPTTDSDIPIYYLTRDGLTGEIKQKVIPGPTVYGLFAQTGDSVPVSATTVETSIINGGVGTLSVPSSGFSIGDSFRANFGGLLSSKNNDTLRIRIKAGSVVLGDSGIQTMPSATNDVWELTINFTIRNIGSAGVASIVTLGTFHSTKQSNNTPIGFAFNTINNTTFDTTISNTLDVTAEWSSNSPLNSIYSDIFVLNKIY